MSGVDGQSLKIPVGILTGGMGRRLGRRKPGVLVGGVPLAERVRRAAAPIAREIVTCGKAGDPDPPPELRRIEERYAERCALSGVVACLAAFPGERVLVLACDHPFLVTGLLSRLAGRASGADVSLPEVAGRLQPLVAVYGPGALDPLQAALAAGHLKLVRVLSALNLDVIREPEVRREDPDLRSFLNVNDATSLADAERRAVEKS